MPRPGAFGRVEPGRCCTQPRTRNALSREKSRSWVTSASAFTAMALAACTASGSLSFSAARSRAALTAISAVSSITYQEVSTARVTLRERLISRQERTGEHLGDGDGGDCERNLAAGMPVEERSKPASERGVPLEEIDDRCAIDHDQRTVLDRRRRYRLHSSRNRRTAAAMSRPHIPLPEPSNGMSGRCRESAARAGTRAAIERPWRVMMVVRPCSASASNLGSCARASSAPRCCILPMGNTVQTVRPSVNSRAPANTRGTS